ncbi:unnamed protein product, partial [Amoebophrya sp. A120]
SAQKSYATGTSAFLPTLAKEQAAQQKEKQKELASNIKPPGMMLHNGTTTSGGSSSSALKPNLSDGGNMLNQPSTGQPVKKSVQFGAITTHEYNSRNSGMGLAHGGNTSQLFNVAGSYITSNYASPAFNSSIGGIFNAGGGVPPNAGGGKKSAANIIQQQIRQQVIRVQQESLTNFNKPGAFGTASSVNPGGFANFSSTSLAASASAPNCSGNQNPRERNSFYENLHQNLVYHYDGPGSLSSQHEDFQVQIGKCLLAVHEKKFDRFYDLLDTCKVALLKTVSITSGELSYERVYPTLIKLHALADLDFVVSKYQTAALYAKSKTGGMNSHESPTVLANTIGHVKKQLSKAGRISALLNNKSFQGNGLRGVSDVLIRRLQSCAKSYDAQELS